MASDEEIKFPALSPVELARVAASLTTAACAQLSAQDEAAALERAHRLFAWHYSYLCRLREKRLKIDDGPLAGADWA